MQLQTLAEFIQTVMDALMFAQLFQVGDVQEEIPTEWITVMKSVEMAMIFDTMTVMMEISSMETGATHLVELNWVSAVTLELLMELLADLGTQQFQSITQISVGRFVEMD